MPLKASPLQALALARQRRAIFRVIQVLVWSAITLVIHAAKLRCPIRPLPLTSRQTGRQQHRQNRYGTGASEHCTGRFLSSALCEREGQRHEFRRCRYCRRCADGDDHCSSPTESVREDMALFVIALQMYSVSCQLTGFYFSAFSR
jgi:hypothetical protein